MLSHLTAPRLATIRAFFRTKTDKEILGCYAWNQAVAAAMLPILGDLEISFRNALHEALSTYYGGVTSFNWMMVQPNPTHVVNAAAPPFLSSKHSLTTRSAQDVAFAVEKVKAKKPAGYVVTPDDVIAALPFGFWEVLVASISHQSHPVGLQAVILADVFPNAPDTATADYGTTAFRKRVTNLLKMIRDFRNRIGHHDALWSTPEFNAYGGVGFIPRHPRHTIISLRQFADSVCWFAGWIDPAISAYIRGSHHWCYLQSLLQRQTLMTYRLSGGKARLVRSTLATNARSCRGPSRAMFRSKLHRPSVGYYF